MYSIAEWTESEVKGIEMSRTEDIRNCVRGRPTGTGGFRSAVQMSVQKLKTATSKYGLKISKSVTKTLTLKGRDPEK